MEITESVTIDDKTYPEALKKIQDPPRVLYFRGNFDITKKACLAIVGTRRCSPYGKRIALEISSELARAGLVIVSGMARGIDTMAHVGCMEARGKTIAVLGTGLDEKSVYPQSNIKLARKIVESGGVLISEYPENTHGSKMTFPKRNRIISGLSFGVLVIEAKKRSGALITAHWAKRQGKKIFATPGPIHSLNSWGPHYLIKKGAELITSADDILEKLNLPRLSCLTSDVKQEGYTPTEKLVLDALKDGAENIEKIIEKTSLPAAAVAGILTNLEIENKIRNLGGNTFAIAK